MNQEYSNSCRINQGAIAAEQIKILILLLLSANCLVLILIIDRSVHFAVDHHQLRCLDRLIHYAGARHVVLQLLSSNVVIIELRSLRLLISPAAPIVQSILVAVFVIE